MSQNRNRKIDFYKGMLIWGVIWGHAITCLLQEAPNEVGIHPIFRTYDMPFFMLISGYFLSFSMKKYSFAKLIKNKITTIAFPTLFWSLVSSLFSSITGFYFLWAVFWSAVMVCVTNKVVTQKRWQVILYIAITIVLHLQPYSLSNLPYLFPYFVLGYYGYEWLFGIKRKLLYVLPFFILELCFWNTDYNIWNAGADLIGGGTSLVNAILFRTFIAISGMLVAKELFDILYKYLSENYPRVCTFFLDCGKETLAMYILHVIILERIIRKIVHLTLNIFGYNIFVSNHLLLGYFVAPILSLAIMIIIVWFVKWCKDYHYTDKLFGFKI